MLVLISGISMTAEEAVAFIFEFLFRVFFWNEVVGLCI